MNNKALYINICAQHPELPVFIQPWWLDLVCPDWNAAIVVKGDLVKGIWPYPVEHKLGTGILRTPILTPYLGPIVFYPPDIKESNKDSHEHEIITELLVQLPPAKVWSMAMQPGLKQAGIFKQRFITPQVQQTFRISLRFDEQVLLGNMKDTLRRNIRQAEKEVIITNEPALLNSLLDFHRQTLQRKNKGKSYPAAKMQNILNACIANDAGALWVAREADKVLAIVWQVWDTGCSYYLMGAQNPETNGYKAMSLLLWHCMKEARNRGIPMFDLEGSMDEGVERFFRGFGGQRELFMVLVKNDSLIWKVKQMLVG